MECLRRPGAARGESFPPDPLETVRIRSCRNTVSTGTDTDGPEPKITQQPDQLVLQLGTRWAGVEFELRTDAGVFPAPIVVDETGVLTMDLGGSTTYTLSCINSTVPIPDPPAEQVPDTQQPPDSSAQQPSGQVQQPQEQVPAGEPADVPIAPMVVFFVGLACGIGGLVALYFAKRRRQQADYDEWAEEDEEQY